MAALSRPAISQFLLPWHSFSIAETTRARLDFKLNDKFYITKIHKSMTQATSLEAEAALAP